MEPMSPALAGGFFTPEPIEKPECFASWKCLLIFGSCSSMGKLSPNKGKSGEFWTTCVSQPDSRWCICRHLPLTSGELGLLEDGSRDNIGRVCFAKFSFFSPSTADRMISPRPAGPTPSQESLLAGLPYQSRINQPLRAAHYGPLW